MKKAPPIWEHRILRHRFGVSERSPVEVRVSKSNLPAFVYEMHFELEIGIVMEGAMEHEYPNGMRRRSGPGDMWFHGMWEPIGYRVARPPCRRVLILLWPLLVADFFSPEMPDIDWMRPFTAAPERRPVVPPAKRREVLRIGKELAACQGVETGVARLHARHLVIELLAGLQANERPAGNVQPAVLGGARRQRNLSPAIALALESRQHVCVPRAAAACAMSVSSFKRAFKDLMGIPFTQFALRRRLGHVAHALKAGDLPLKQIGKEWGFQSTSHLCRAFAQHYQCTPAKYRARNSNAD